MYHIFLGKWSYLFLFYKLLYWKFTEQSFEILLFFIISTTQVISFTFLIIKILSSLLTKKRRFFHGEILNLRTVSWVFFVYKTTFRYEHSWKINLFLNSLPPIGCVFRGERRNEVVIFSIMDCFQSLNPGEPCLTKIR